MLCMISVVTLLHKFGSSHFILIIPAKSVAILLLISDISLHWLSGTRSVSNLRNVDRRVDATLNNALLVLDKQLDIRFRTLVGKLDRL